MAGLRRDSNPRKVLEAFGIRISVLGCFAAGMPSNRFQMFPVVATQWAAQLNLEKHRSLFDNRATFARKAILPFLVDFVVRIVDFRLPRLRLKSARHPIGWAGHYSDHSKESAILHRPYIFYRTRSANKAGFERRNFSPVLCCNFFDFFDFHFVVVLRRFPGRLQNFKPFPDFDAGEAV